MREARRRATCHPAKQHHALGLCETCYKRQLHGATERVKRVALCHPNRRHHAFGKCQSCYELSRHPRKNVPKKVALCHPDRPHLAKDKCSECYYRDKYQNDPDFKARVLKYQKEYRSKHGETESLSLVEARG